MSVIDYWEIERRIFGIWTTAPSVVTFCEFLIVCLTENSNNSCLRSCRSSWICCRQEVELTICESQIGSLSNTNGSTTTVVEHNICRSSSIRCQDVYSINCLIHTVNSECFFTCCHWSSRPVAKICRAILLPYVSIGRIPV